jgi:hypothetical protein
MSPIFAGLGLIILGLVGAFFGYRIFRVLLPIYGGVAGFLLAWGWWGQNAWLLALVVGVALAVVFAVIAYAFWSTMVAFGGLILGGAIGIVIGTSLNLWGWLTVLLAFGTGIVFAALFYWVRNEMIIISTVASGATLVSRGVGELFGWRSGLEGVFNPNPVWLSILVFAVGIVVFIAGLLYQWRAYAKLRWYDAKVALDAATLSKTAPSTAESYTTRATANINAAAGAAGSAVAGSGAAVAAAAAAAAAAASVTATDAAAKTSETTSDAMTGARGAVVDLAETADEAVSDTAEVVAGAASGVAADAGSAVDAAGDELSGATEVAAEVVADVKAGAAGPVVGAGALLTGADDAVVDTAGEAEAVVPDAVEADENKAEAAVDSAANVLDIDLDDNKVSNALADLEKSFQGLQESAKFKEALDFVEGIGPTFAGKLKELDVNNVLDLLRKGATRKGRADLAEKSGIAGKLILEWVNHADLYRVKGVGSEFADLLVAAGVDTVPELAQRNPVKLFEKMQATNEEKRLVRRAPHPSEVEDWVNQAKNLPRIIQY